MSASEYIVALGLLGLASNVHCIAMCGPLAARACCASGRMDPVLSLQYLAGRMTSYVFLGALVGFAGARLVVHAGAPLRVVIAELVALILLVQALRLWKPGWFSLRRFGLLAKPVATLSSVLPRRGLGLGLITGFLPCGALYAALGVAAASADPLVAAAGLALFAVASIPGLLAAAAGVAFVGRSPQRNWKLRRGLAGSGALALALLAFWIAARPLLPHHGHHDHHGGHGAHEGAALEAAVSTRES